MEPLYYVMAIIGCSDGQTVCSEARIEPARYASIAQCRAAMPRALGRNTDLAFPVIAATCRQMGTVMARNDARIRPAG